MNLIWCQALSSGCSVRTIPDNSSKRPRPNHNSPSSVCGGNFAINHGGALTLLPLRNRKAFPSQYARTPSSFSLMRYGAGSISSLATRASNSGGAMALAPCAITSGANKYSSSVMMRRMNIAFLLLRTRYHTPMSNIAILSYRRLPAQQQRNVAAYPRNRGFGLVTCKIAGE